MIPPTECLVSTFTVRINLKTFPWDVRSAEERYLPKFSATFNASSDTIWHNVRWALGLTTSLLISATTQEDVPVSNGTVGSNQLTDSPAASRQQTASELWWLSHCLELRREIITTILCCKTIPYDYDSCAHWYIYACERFLNLRVGLDLVFVYMFRFTIYLFF